MATPAIIVAGTGHRPDKLGGYSEDAYLRLIDLAGPWLEEHSPDSVISGMALGWDQALADAAIYLKIPVIAAIPFVGQELKWPKQSQEKYHTILSQVLKVVPVCEPGYAAYKMQLRNTWMVDNATEILAIYNGDLFGGTYNCIQYAIKKGKPIYNLWNGLKQD